MLAYLPLIVVGGAITRVIGSKASKVRPGDIVHSLSGWTRELSEPLISLYSPSQGFLVSIHT